MNIINVSNKVVGVEEIQTVNARELHGYLGVGKVFNDWVKSRIEDYDFQEGKDYILTESKVGLRMNVIQKDYHVSLDMAKELSMVDRGIKGKEARKYFIQCEKKLQTSGITLPNFVDPVEAATAWIAQYKATQVVQIELNAVKMVAIENEPKINFYNTVVEYNSEYTLAEAAKLLGTGRTRFSDYLKQNGYMGKDRTPYQKHITAKIMSVKLAKYREAYTGIEHITATPYITGKGLTHFQKKFSV